MWPLSPAAQGVRKNWPPVRAVFRLGVGLRLIGHRIAYPIVSIELAQARRVCLLHETFPYPYPFPFPRTCTEECDYRNTRGLKSLEISQPDVTGDSR